MKQRVPLIIIIIVIMIVLIAIAIEIIRTIDSIKFHTITRGKRAKGKIRTIITRWITHNTCPQSEYNAITFHADYLANLCANSFLCPNTLWPNLIGCAFHRCHMYFVYIYMYMYVYTNNYAAISELEATSVKV